MRVDDYQMKKRLPLVFLLILVVFIIGISYAYFVPSVVGNDNNSSIGSKTANLELSITDVINSAGLINRPGDKIETSFTVTNTGSDTINGYDIYLTNVINEFNRKEDLVYNISCSSSVPNKTCNSVTDDVMVPSSDASIYKSSSISKNESHSYKIVIKYLKKNVNQSIDMNKVFSSKIRVVSEKYENINTASLKTLESSTSSNIIKLYASSPGAVKMCFSNEAISNNCNWIDYSESVQEWKLIGNYGTKVIYAFFKDAEGKVYGPVNTAIIYREKISNTIKEVSGANYSGEFWKYKDNIIKVVLNNTLTRPNDELIDSWDVSIDHDESVMAYLTKDNVLYITSDGNIHTSENSNYLFYGFTNLESIENIEYLDTSMSTTMKAMFSKCSKLNKLDLSNFNTNKVTDMSFMFSGCTNLSNINLGGIFNTDKVTTMKAMFQNCTALNSLNLNNFRTLTVIDMSYMFANNSSLKNLNLSNFVTMAVSNMKYMFYNTTSLVSLNLKNVTFNTVMDASNIFKGINPNVSILLSDDDSLKFIQARLQELNLTSVKISL